MTWDRAAAADALVSTLGAATGVKAFPRPPATFNPPAYIIAHPTTVDYSLPAFGVDTAAIAVICVAGLDQADRVDQLLVDAVAALGVDTRLGGAVQVLQVRQQTNWRPLNVAGADYIAADLTLNIRM